MDIHKLSNFNESHLILTFVKKGKIRSNKIVYFFELLNRRQLNDHCLEFCVVNYFKLSWQLLKIGFKNSFEFSPWLTISKISKTNFFCLNFQFGRLWITLLMKSCELWWGILSFFNGLFDKFYSLDLSCSSQVMSHKCKDDFNVFTLVFDIFFTLKSPLYFLRKTVGLTWITLVYNDFYQIFSCKGLILYHRNILNRDLLF